MPLANTLNLNESINKLITSSKVLSTVNTKESRSSSHKKINYYNQSTIPPTEINAKFNISNKILANNNRQSKSIALNPKSILISKYGISVLREEMDSLRNINGELWENIVDHYLFLQLAKRIKTRETFLCYNICSYQFGLLELKDYDSLNRNLTNVRLEKRFKTLASEIDCVAQGY